MQEPQTHRQGRRHEISTGGTDFDWGRDSGESKPSIPRFRFLLGFCPLYLGNIKNFKILTNIQNIFFKNRDFWGTSPPEFHPPVATSMRIATITVLGPSLAVRNMMV